jgi:predicted ATPase
MCVILGQALMVTRGYSATEVEQTYAHARTLCQKIENTPQLFPVLCGVFSFHLVQGKYQIAQEIANQLLTQAQSQQEQSFSRARRKHTVYLLEAHLGLGLTAHMIGELEVARAHFEHGIALYDRQQHASHIQHFGMDSGTNCLSKLASVLWLQGYPDQALQRCHESISLTQELAHSHSLAQTLMQAGRLYVFRREWQKVQESAEVIIDLSTGHEFAQTRAAGMMLHGLALIEQGHVDEGLLLIQQGETTRQHAGPLRPFHFILSIEALKTAERHAEGLVLLTRVFSLVNQMQERVFEAELHRLKGELLLQQSLDNATEAETCFHHAISIAQNQSAKSWELRAATSLARLWQSQGKRNEARQLLAPVYNWFTEGFDTADLKDAKALLDELA